MIDKTEIFDVKIRNTRKNPFITIINNETDCKKNPPSFERFKHSKRGGFCKIKVF